MFISKEIVKTEYYQRIQKVIFYKESKSNKKFCQVGGEGAGVWLG